MTGVHVAEWWKWVWNRWQSYDSITDFERVRRDKNDNKNIYTRKRKWWEIRDNSMGKDWYCSCWCWQTSKHLFKGMLLLLVLCHLILQKKIYISAPFFQWDKSAMQNEWFIWLPVCQKRIHIMLSTFLFFLRMLLGSVFCTKLDNHNFKQHSYHWFIKFYLFRFRWQKKYVWLQQPSAKLEI